MPRPVKAWACEFGCRIKVQTNKDRILHHEAYCFNNPATKSCRTCVLFDQGDGDEYQPYCEGEHFEPTKKNPVGFRTQCPYWIERKKR